MRLAAGCSRQMATRASGCCWRNCKSQSCKASGAVPMRCARLVPARRGRGRRKPGRFVGKGRIADDFNAPLPPEILAEFLK